MEGIFQRSVCSHASPCTSHSAFHEFPVEIVRMIFEMAAHSCATACALCLVSKGVKAWITPFLYNTVIIVDSKTKNHWNAFYNTMTLTRHGCSQTRSLVLRQPTVIPGFNFKDFSRIRNLVLHVLELPDVAATESPKSPFLTHLTLNGLPYSGVFSLPLFRTITHLHLPHGIPHDGCQLTPENLPNLTHIVCTLFNLSKRNMNEWQKLQKFVDIVNSFTNLRTAAVYLLRQDGSPDVVIEMASLLERLARMSRIPLLIRPGKLFSLCDSESWIKGGESIWEKAERDMHTVVDHDSACC